MGCSDRLTLIVSAVVLISSCSITTQNVILKQGGITGTPADAILAPLIVGSAYSKENLPTIEYGPGDDEIAVEEFNKGIIDKNLWGEALIDADCDETKRRSSYLKLRANQLRETRRANLTRLRADQALREKQLTIEQTQDSDVEVNLAADRGSDEQPGNGNQISNIWIENLSGNYISDITSNSNFSFVKRYQELEINIIQIGKCITAFDDRFKTKISGTIEGGLVKFQVDPGQASGFYGAKGEWKIENADGMRLVGFWSIKGVPEASGLWKLVKIE